MPVAEFGVTFAVQVTVWPAVAGLGDTDRLIDGFACATFTVRAADELGESVAPPEYPAVTEWLPAESVAIDSFA